MTLYTLELWGWINAAGWVLGRIFARVCKDWGTGTGLVWKGAGKMYRNPEILCTEAQDVVYKPVFGPEFV